MSHLRSGLRLRVGPGFLSDAMPCDFIPAANRRQGTTAAFGRSAAAAHTRVTFFELRDIEITAAQLRRAAAVPGVRLLISLIRRVAAPFANAKPQPGRRFVNA